jgi:hypothetical protein
LGSRWGTATGVARWEDAAMSDADAFLRQMAASSAPRFGGVPCTTFELLAM